MLCSKHSYRGRGAPEDTGTEVNWETGEDGLDAQIAKMYAENHKSMNGESCNKTLVFKNGIIDLAKLKDIRSEKICLTLNYVKEYVIILFSVLNRESVWI